MLGGEGVVGNTIRVKGILEWARVWVGGGEKVSGAGRRRRGFELKTLRRGLKIAAVRGGSKLSESRVDDDHRLRSW